MSENTLLLNSLLKEIYIADSDKNLFPLISEMTIPEIIMTIFIDPASSSQISEITKKTDATIGETALIIDKLLNKDLVGVTTNRDYENHDLIGLSEKGLSVRAVLVKSVENLFRILTEEERNSFTSVLYNLNPYLLKILTKEVHLKW